MTTSRPTTPCNPVDGTGAASLAPNGATNYRILSGWKILKLGQSLEAHRSSRADNKFRQVPRRRR